VTFESSAFLQYSLQYLLSFVALQSQTPCAHFSFSAISPTLLSWSTSRSIISALQRNTETTRVDAAVGAESVGCVVAGALRQFATALLRNECARLDCQSQTIHQLQQRRL
jgi:hypothetical protein